ncbi:hypothetical protein Poli38472_011241 [Pythium oligandrum]|uniref:Uncharacterized protein n=1 Tax=Pythium oligandrum TaxID=41045 RepID=A0A8K1FLX7_PYTOL|nr:hypothetical protein Poli38472_011241 [Pythium oligandrum]|eukprot:TMW67621.1 hypothetical protein Poli38472_011241 [Pythium oligandrum]
MKLAAIVLAATVAVASAETTPYCDVSALLKVVQTPHSQACFASTGFNVAVSKAVTADNAAKICSEATCQAVLAETTDTFKTDCLTANNIPILAGVVKPSEAACAKFSTPACDTAIMLKVVTTDNARVCTALTGFSIAAAKPLKADDAAKVCPMTSCQGLFREILSTVTTDCTLFGGPLLVGDIMKQTEEACAEFAAESLTN